MKKTLAGVLAIGMMSAAPAWAVIGGGDITFTVNGADPVTYSHERHVSKAGLKCAECHPKIFAQSRLRKISMTDMQNGLYCGSCHNGQRAFDVKGNCGRCHVKQ